MGVHVSFNSVSDKFSLLSRFQDDAASDDNNYEHLVQWWCTIDKETKDRLQCYIIVNNIDLLMLYLDLESIYRMLMFEKWKSKSVAYEGDNYWGGGLKL